MTKNVMIWPSTVPLKRPTDTNVMLTALSMISIDRRIVIRLRRRKTPAVPMENSTPDRIRKWLSVGMSGLPPGDHHGGDHRDEDEDRGDLERERVRREERRADPRDAA